MGGLAHGVAPQVRIELSVGKILGGAPQPPGHQRGLSDPGLPGYHDERRRLLPGAVEQTIQRGEIIHPVREMR